MTNSKIRWTADDVDWGRFDRRRADPDVAYVAKTVALVESRADLYSGYLRQLFPDCPEVQRQLDEWGREEAVHGEVLLRWAQLYDEDFDPVELDREYRKQVAYHDTDGRSVRGSRTAEFVCRCVVEAMASTYYLAIFTHCEEPVLRDIARRLMRDEARHFTMFRRLLAAARRQEGGSKLSEIFVAVRRMLDLDDDQVVYASFCANRTRGAARYDRPLARAAYLPRVYRLLGPDHVAYALKMIARALDVPAPKFALWLASWIAIGILRAKSAGLTVGAWLRRAVVSASDALGRRRRSSPPARRVDGEVPVAR